MLNEDSGTNKKLNIWLPFLLSIILVLGMLIGMKLQPTSHPVASNAEPAEIPPSSLGQGKIEELIRYVEAKYVDEIDRDELVKQAIDNILEKLDPHSNYIPASQLKEVNDHLEGKFDGIGIEFLMIDDTLIVVKPLKDGPSEAAGILAGDKIVQVEDSLIAGKNLNSENIMDLLKGEKGTEVNIGILRGNDREILKYNLKRDKIPMYSVDVAYMLDEKTGYIKLNRFSATTYEEFMENLERLVEDHEMKDLVVDLRGNPGGYLQEATNILSQLFNEKDKLLVYTEGRAVHRNEYESTGRNFYEVDQIAVLIDEGSASASEIMAGAVQDWDRGMIVGRRSFGKGLVQEQYRLRDGSALRLTVARYYTPSGRLIQKDYDDIDAYDKDVMDRFSNGELYHEDSIYIADTTKYETASGRTVFGGGGISPDHFVPFDSLILNDYYLRLRSHVPTFVYKYMTKNKSKFDEMSLEQFEKEYSVNNALLKEFESYAVDNGVEYDYQSSRKMKSYVKLFLKARMAKHLFEDVGFFRVFNKEDEVIDKALDALKEEKAISQN